MDPGKEELYTRELARLSFLALRTVQDEVAKLEAANLIVSRSNGYQRFYRANSKHPLYRVLPELVRKGTQQGKPKPRQLPSRLRDERSADGKTSHDAEVRDRAA